MMVMFILVSTNGDDKGSYGNEGNFPKCHSSLIIQQDKLLRCFKLSTK